MTQNTFANGMVLTSSALTSKAMDIAMQALTCAVFGLDVANPNPNAYALVRLDWPTGGAPGWTQTEDIAFLQATLHNEDWGKIRDEQVSDATPDGATLEIAYDRVWEVRWILYGPNSGDRARLLVSAMFLDWPHDTLAESNLSLVTNIDPPRRAPENFEGGWWERTDVSMRFNEGVLETIAQATGISVEIETTTNSGRTEEVTITSGASA